MFKDRLKELRKAKNLTQAELSKLLNVSQQTVGSWEVGRAEPNTDTINKIASFFDVTTDFLLGNENASTITNDKVMTVAAHIDDDTSDEEMEEILDYIAYIKSKHRKK